MSKVDLHLHTTCSDGNLSPIELVNKAVAVGLNVISITDHDSTEGLYETIVNHRYVFTKLGGVDYNLHRPQEIRPVPSAEYEEDWKADYKTMQEQMIYGDSPAYKDLVKGIQGFLEKMTALDWRMGVEFPLPKS